MIADLPLVERHCRIGVVLKVVRFSLRPRGHQIWDAVVRGSGCLGVLGIALTCLIPDCGPLIGLGVFTIWISGPQSPFFPVALEPVLMLFGQLYAPWLVATVTVIAAVYIESINYHVYGRMTSLDVFRPLRESTVVRWSRDLFESHPFLATWLFVVSPLPYWAIRILAPMTRYPMWRYLMANVLARYPKYWFFSSVGLWLTVSNQVLLLVSVAGIVAGSVAWAAHAWRGQRTVALDTPALDINESDIRLEKGQILPCVRRDDEQVARTPETTP